MSFCEGYRGIYTQKRWNSTDLIGNRRCYSLEMDPLTAIGLASGILTFLDFAQKVVTGADELYKKDTTDDNVHAEAIANDLDDAATDLATLPGKTKHEKALNRLAENCRSVAQDLQQLLKKLTVSGKRTPWNITKVAIRSVRKRGDVQRLLERLGEYRGAVLVRLNLMMKYDISKALRQLVGDRTNIQVVTNNAPSESSLIKSRLKD